MDWREDVRINNNPTPASVLGLPSGIRVDEKSASKFPPITDSQNLFITSFNNEIIYLSDKGDTFSQKINFSKNNPKDFVPNNNIHNNYSSF